MSTASSITKYLPGSSPHSSTNGPSPAYRNSSPSPVVTGVSFGLLCSTQGDDPPFVTAGHRLPLQLLVPPMVHSPGCSPCTNTAHTSQQLSAFPPLVRRHLVNTWTRIHGSQSFFESAFEGEHLLNANRPACLSPIACRLQCHENGPTSVLSKSQFCRNKARILNLRLIELAGTQIPPDHPEHLPDLYAGPSTNPSLSGYFHSQLN